MLDPKAKLEPDPGYPEDEARLDNKSPVEISLNDLQAACDGLGHSLEMLTADLMVVLKAPESCNPCDANPQKASCDLCNQLDSIARVVSQHHETVKQIRSRLAL